MHTVLVPKTLTWDKLTGLYLYVVFVLKTTFDRVSILFEDEVSDPRQALREGAFDLDVVRKYNAETDERGRKKYGSAAHRVAIERRVGNIPGMERLIGLCNRNNETGYLKGYPRSYVWLIREAYELGRNVDAHTHKVNVIRMFWPVLESFFAAAAKDLDAVEAIENPFSAAGYAVLMEIEGLPKDEIDCRLAVYDDYFERAGDRRDRTVEKVKEGYASTREFAIPWLVGGETVGHLVESDDRRIRNPYFDTNSDVRLLVVRGSSGHYAIFPRGHQDFRQLHRALEAREPGKWFLDDRPDAPLLLNGSSARHAQPSELKPAEIIAIIQANYRHRNSWQQDDLRRQRDRLIPHPGRR